MSLSWKHRTAIRTEVGGGVVVMMCVRACVRVCVCGRDTREKEAIRMQHGNILGSYTGSK